MALANCSFSGLTDADKSRDHGHRFAAAMRRLRRISTLPRCGGFRTGVAAEQAARQVLRGLIEQEAAAPSAAARQTDSSKPTGSPSVGMRLRSFISSRSAYA